MTPPLKKKVKYPSIPRDERKTTKIPLAEHVNIRTMHAQGISTKQIAATYDVTTVTIRCIIDRDYYERQKASKKRWDAEHYQEVYEKSKPRTKKWIIEQVKTRPEFKEYHLYQISKWGQQHKDRKRKAKQKWRQRLRAQGIKPS